MLDFTTSCDILVVTPGINPGHDKGRDTDMVQLKFNPTSELVELEKIAAQLEAAAGVTRETRQRAKLWAGMADTIDGAITATEGPYASVALDHNSLNLASETLRKVSALLNPVADLPWTREHLAELSMGVEFFRARGIYEGEEAARADTALRAIAEATKTRNTNGTRAPRSETPPIEGRPAVILVSTPDGGKISEQSGNKDNSVSNITASIRKHAEKGGVMLTNEQNAAVRECVRRAVEDGASPVTVGDFAVLTHVAS